MRAAHIRCSCAAAVVSGTYLTENSFVSVKRAPSADRTMRTKSLKVKPKGTAD